MAIFDFASWVISGQSNLSVTENGVCFFLVERFNGDRDDHPWVPHVWSHAGHFPVESQDSRHRGSLGTAVPGVGGDETKWNIVKPIKRPTLFFLYLWAVWEYLLLRPKMGCYPKACR